MIQDLHHHLKKAVSGFTLIEILIVITVVGVLGTATVNRIEGQQGRSRNVARKTMVNQLASAITTFYSTNRYWPSTLDSLKPHYVNTLPVDPKGLDACNTATTSDGKYGYATYINGGENGEKNGFMIFAQVEKGGQGLDYGNIYILTGSGPCQDSALGGSRVDWFRVANARCTSKPGWTDNNTPFIAFHPNPLQQLVIDITQPRRVWAVFGGTGLNSQPWTNVKNNDSDGDGTRNNRDIQPNNPCEPDPFANNCDRDTDEDGIFDSVEGFTTDTDGDGIPDYQESSVINSGARDDPDGDMIPNQFDPDNNNPCIPFTTSMNCDIDSDADNAVGEGTDSEESAGTDADGDGIPNYLESTIEDRDGDGIADQWDSDRPYCNGLAADIYVSPIIDGVRYIIGGPQHLQVYAGVINAGNGKSVIVGTEGNDIINGGNGKDTICAGGGDDIINGGNGGDVIICGGGTDNVVSSNGQDTCSADCEIPPSNGCNIISNSLVGISYEPPPNTITCNPIVIPLVGDIDNDGYLDKIGLASSDANADTDTGNSCLPNSRVHACAYSGAIALQYPSGTCFDNDDDGHFNNVPHNHLLRDPNDQNPCSPDPTTQGCDVNSDADGDGYRTNVASGHSMYDPDDGNVCVPFGFDIGTGTLRADCDADGDGISNNLEGMTTDNDTFFRYEDELAHMLYSGLYITMLGGVSEINGDGIPNYLESAIEDRDGDGIPDQFDPLDTGPWARCIPSNFGIGCHLDFDGDGIPDWQEGPTHNADDTPDFPGGDEWPNWIESTIASATSYSGLYNPAGPNGDPDQDGYPNQIDPDNFNPCIPDASTQACLDYAPSEEVYTGYVLQGVDCSAITILPYGSRAFYIWMY